MQLSELLTEEKNLEQKLKDSKDQLLNSDLNSQELKLMEELNEVRGHRFHSIHHLN